MFSRSTISLIAPAPRPLAHAIAASSSATTADSVPAMHGDLHEQHRQLHLGTDRWATMPPSSVAKAITARAARASRSS